MNNNLKIKLKNKNSNKNVINILEKISTGNITKINCNNFKTLSNFLICAICVLVGICITPTLLQKHDKNIFVKYNNSDSQSTNSKEKAVKSNPNNNNKHAKLSNRKKSKSKHSNNKLNNNYKVNNKIHKSKENGANQEQYTDTNKTNNIEYQNNFYGNSISNVLNGNFLAEEDGSLFYINYNDSNYIYRIDILTGQTDLILNISCREICILNGKLYAVSLDFNDELIIYDIQTNEYKKANISKRCLNINCDYIVSCDENGIYKSYMFDTSNLTKEIHTGDINKCALYDEVIYFIEYDNLYSIDLDGNNQTLIRENVQNFTISNSEIYYVSNNQLYSTNSDKPIYDISLSAINIYNNTLFFSNEDDGGKLYSINMLTYEIKKLSDDVAEQICVTDHKVAIITPECDIVLI